MPDRAKALRDLSVGDIISAVAPNGARPFCLVTGVTATAVQARSITTRIQLTFDRRSGIAKFDNATVHRNDDIVPYTIDSVAPLPRDIHDAILNLDRRFGSGGNTEELALSKDEQQAIIFALKHYDANPI